MNSSYRAPTPVNEPVRSFQPGSPERDSLKASLAELSAQQVEIPLLIGGREVRTGNTASVVMPHRHGHVLATWHKAGAKETEQAIAAAALARKEWASWSFEDRAAVFLRAAELLAGPEKNQVRAATMLTQSKTAHQAEIG
jgi:1-pyrroline-5-carboxylate dehydrogenase